MMKVFKDLTLDLNGLALDVWLLRAEPHLRGDWRRSLDLEQEARKFGVGSEPYRSIL